MSPAPVNVQGIINAALAALPSILALIKDARAKADPNAPPMTDDEARAGLAFAVASSVAKDDAWDRAHPKPPETP